MNKINIVTYPDILHNNALSLVLVFPTRELLTSLQDEFLKDFSEEDVNLYLFDRLEYNKEEINWLLTVAKSADFTIIDTDNTIPYFRDLLGYLIARQNSYWFSKTDNSIYKHLSTNQVYNLDFLPLPKKDD